MVANSPVARVEGPRAAARRRKASGVVVPHAPYWYQRLGGRLVYLLVRSVSATLRYRWTDGSASYRLGWKIQAKSWDRCQIPLPFSRCEMVLGKAVQVPREASDTEREVLLLQLEWTLK
jgi:hypothetical protein